MVSLSFFYLFLPVILRNIFFDYGQNPFVFFVDDPEAHAINWSFTLMLQLHRVFLPTQE